jgi:hypothetical protein
MSHKKVNPKMKPVNTTAAKEKASLLNSGYLPYILALVLFLFVSLLYFPAAYKHMEPQASDINQWRGAAKSIIDYNEQNPDTALWTQNMFSGMPSYMISFPNRYPFLESITKLTDRVISWRIFLLIIGGLGMFVLLLHLKIDWAQHQIPCHHVYPLGDVGDHVSEEKARHPLSGARRYLPDHPTEGKPPPDHLLSLSLDWHVLDLPGRGGNQEEGL